MNISAYSLHDVTFSYGERTVLEIDRLEFAQGEIVVLAGPNGSGKTTLLHLLAFLEIPLTGEITFFGEKTGVKDVIGLRRQVGLMLQNPYLFNETVLSNLTWALALRGNKGSQAKQAALNALVSVGLAGFGNRRARSLSGGESQRTALARLLTLNQEVLLLDEPFNHMDKESSDITHKLVQELNQQQGKTIIMTSHAADTTPHKAHRVVNLCNGRVVSCAE
jgi:tungstate transport system ATP-binding protein